MINVLHINAILPHVMIVNNATRQRIFQTPYNPSCGPVADCKYAMLASNWKVIHAIYCTFNFKILLEINFEFNILLTDHSLGVSTHYMPATFSNIMSLQSGPKSKFLLKYHKILLLSTDLRNDFTDTRSRKFAIKPSLKNALKLGYEEVRLVL